MNIEDMKLHPQSIINFIEVCNENGNDRLQSKEAQLVWKTVAIALEVISTIGPLK